MKKGSYFKLVGSYEGVLWNGRKWQRFECQSCLLTSGMIKGPAIQGPMTPKAAEALNGPVFYRHVRGMHK